MGATPSADPGWPGSFAGVATIGDPGSTGGANADGAEEVAVAGETAGVARTEDAGRPDAAKLAEVFGAPGVAEGAAACKIPVSADVSAAPTAFDGAASRSLFASAESGAAPAFRAASIPLVRAVHCAAFCSMERSVSLIRSGAGGGPAGLAGTAADDVAAAKKESLETTGGEDAPRAGGIDAVREAACETPAGPDARSAPGALRLSDERDTSGRRAAPASAERSAPRVAAVGALFDDAVPAVFGAREAACSRVPDDAPVFNQPGGATGSSGSLAPAARPLCKAVCRASGKRSE